MNLCYVCSVESETLVKYQYPNIVRNVCIDCYKAIITGLDVYNGNIDLNEITPRLTSIEIEFTNAMTKMISNYFHDGRANQN